MQGTILEFLKLATEKPQLAKELVELAGKYDFQFSDEVSDEDLDAVSGGGTVKVIMSSLTGGGMPDGMTDPMGSTPSTPVVPTPYPDVAGSPDGGVVYGSDGGTGSGDDPGTAKGVV